MRKFVWSLLLLPAFLRVASACSCAGYPEPFCARNLSRIDSKQTVVFVGRVTSAPGGFQELKDEMSAAGQSRDGAAGVTVHRSGSEELAQSVEQARGALLDSYGARLSDKQRALLRNAKSMVELLELRPMLYELGRPVRLEVVENLIGELPRSVEIFTGRGGGDCGFDFAPGELYVVEAHRNSNGE